MILMDLILIAHPSGLLGRDYTCLFIPVYLNFLFSFVSRSILYTSDSFLPLVRPIQVARAMHCTRRHCNGGRGACVPYGTSTDCYAGDIKL